MRKDYLKAQHKMMQDSLTEKEHYKLYKAGKLWLVAGLATLSFGIVELTSTPNVQAAVPTTTVQTTMTTTASTSAAPVTDSVANSTASANTAVASAPATNSTSTAANADSTNTAAPSTVASTVNNATDPAAAASTANTDSTATGTSAAATSTTALSTGSAASSTAATVTNNTSAESTARPSAITTASNATASVAASSAANNESATNVRPTVTNSVQTTDLGAASSTTITAAKSAAAATYAQTGVAQTVTAVDATAAQSYQVEYVDEKTSKVVDTKKDNITGVPGATVSATDYNAIYNLDEVNNNDQNGMFWRPAADAPTTFTLPTDGTVLEVPVETLSNNVALLNQGLVTFVDNRGNVILANVTLQSMIDAINNGSYALTMDPNALVALIKNNYMVGTTVNDATIQKMVSQLQAFYAKEALLYVLPAYGKISAGIATAYWNHQIDSYDEYDPSVNVEQFTKIIPNIVSDVSTTTKNIVDTWNDKQTSDFPDGSGATLTQLSTSTVDENGEPIQGKFTGDLSSYHLTNGPTDASNYLVVQFNLGAINVGVNYVDTEGHSLADSTTLATDYQTTNTLTGAKIAGYHVTAIKTSTGLVPVDSDVAAGTLDFTAPTDGTVTFVYTNKSTVTLTPVDPAGKPISGTTPTDVTGTTGEKVTPPDIPGYTVQPGQTVTIPNNDTNVDVVYTPTEQLVTVHYVYTDGTKAAADQSEIGVTGESYSLNSPLITGYTADQTVVTGVYSADSKQNVFTVTYKKNAPTSETTTGNPVDSTGTPISGAPTANLPIDKNGNVTVPNDVPGYTPSTAKDVDPQTPGVQVPGNANKTTDLPYTKLTAGTVTQHVTQTSGANKVTAQPATLGTAKRTAYTGTNGVGPGVEPLTAKQPTKRVVTSVAAATKLPQTGEQNENFLALLGASLLGMLSLLGFDKKQRRHSR